MDPMGNDVQSAAGMNWWKVAQALWSSGVLVGKGAWEVSSIDWLLESYLSPPNKYLGGGNSNIFYVHPYLGKISILTHIFQLGWNHQLDTVAFWKIFPIVL